MYAKVLKLYCSGDGSVPFEEWLDELDRQTRARIRVRLDRVEQGNLGDCKSVAKGVSELRCKFGPGYRVYVAIHGEILVILLGGGDKGSQKQDIKRAQERWAELQAKLQKGEAWERLRTITRR